MATLADDVRNRAFERMYESYARDVYRYVLAVPLDDVVTQLSVPESDRPNVRELLKALGRLPFNQRAAIAMRELEGRSYQEIAETLDVTVPTVEALLVRARRTLRSQRAAVRGLMVVQLPRSLRSLFEHADATTAVAGGSSAAACS